METDCPDGVSPGSVFCATLSVPADADDTGAGDLQLSVVVVPALEPKRGAAPLVQLAGGPGNPMTDTASWFLEPGSSSYELRRHRDVILIDQRGTGGSHPLRCPALETIHPLDRMYPPAQVRQCRDELEASHDLTSFGTLAAARDLDRVRQALGHDQVDLWAVSYGTVLAQIYLRTFPDRVRSAVLVGTAPLDARFPLYHATNAQRVLDLVFLECESEAACSRAFPDLRRAWARLLARLGSSEQQVAGKTIRRDVFGEAFRGLLSSTAGQRTVPWIIHEASRGNFQPFLDALPEPSDDGFAEGLYLSITCAESTAWIAADEIESAVAGTFLGEYRVREQMAACSEWPREKPPGTFLSPVDSAVPVLLLVGEMDAVTPPSWSERVARGLSNSLVVRMPHAGHLFWAWEPSAVCFDELALELYSRGEVNGLDTSCATRAQPPSFYIP